MGAVFEELIRKFAEISNETAGEHSTPREVLRLMVNLLFIEDDDVLTPGTAVVRTIYDPTAGMGGMLSIAAEHLLAHNPKARLTMYGQELNDESYAICKADMLIKGQAVENIIAGNTLSDDCHAGRKFDYRRDRGSDLASCGLVLNRQQSRVDPTLPSFEDPTLLAVSATPGTFRPAEAKAFVTPARNASPSSIPPRV